MSQSDITPKTSTTDNVKPLQIHKAQLAGVQSLRTKCNLPGAEDVEASSNRIIAIQWLYRLSGRTNGLYTGLWAAFQKQLADAKAEV